MLLNYVVLAVQYFAFLSARRCHSALDLGISIDLVNSIPKKYRSCWVKVNIVCGYNVDDKGKHILYLTGLCIHLKMKAKNFSPEGETFKS